MNTMTKQEITLANTLIQNTGLSVLDAVRLALNILDARAPTSKIPPMEFCHKVIEIGKRHIYQRKMKVIDGISEYIIGKKHLRAESQKDIRYLSEGF